MQELYIVIRLFPFWALPLAVILVELSRHFNRKKAKGWQWGSFITAILLVILSVAWLFLGGFEGPDEYLRPIREEALRLQEK